MSSKTSSRLSMSLPLSSRHANNNTSINKKRWTSIIYQKESLLPTPNGDNLHFNSNSGNKSNKSDGDCKEIDGKEKNLKQQQYCNTLPPPMMMTADSTAAVTTGAPVVTRNKRPRQSILLPCDYNDIDMDEEIVDNDNDDEGIDNDCADDTDTMETPRKRRRVQKKLPRQSMLLPNKDDFILAASTSASTSPSQAASASIAADTASSGTLSPLSATQIEGRTANSNTNGNTAMTPSIQSNVSKNISSKRKRKARVSMMLPSGDFNLMAMDENSNTNRKNNASTTTTIIHHNGTNNQFLLTSPASFSSKSSNQKHSSSKRRSSKITKIKPRMPKSSTPKSSNNRQKQTTSTVVTATITLPKLSKPKKVCPEKLKKVKELIRIFCSLPLEERYKSKEATIVEELTGYPLINLMDKARRDREKTIATTIPAGDYNQSKGTSSNASSKNTTDGGGPVEDLTPSPSSDAAHPDIDIDENHSNVKGNTNEQQQDQAQGHPQAENTVEEEQKRVLSNNVRRKIITQMGSLIPIMEARKKEDTEFMEEGTGCRVERRKGKFKYIEISSGRKVSGHEYERRYLLALEKKRLTDRSFAFVEEQSTSDESLPTEEEDKPPQNFDKVKPVCVPAIKKEVHIDDSAPLSPPTQQEESINEEKRKGSTVTNQVPAQDSSAVVAKPLKKENEEVLQLEEIPSRDEISKDPEVAAAQKELFNAFDNALRKYSDEILRIRAKRKREEEEALLEKN